MILMTFLATPRALVEHMAQTALCPAATVSWTLSVTPSPASVLMDARMVLRAISARKSVSRAHLDQAVPARATVRIETRCVTIVTGLVSSQAVLPAKCHLTARQTV